MAKKLTIWLPDTWANITDQDPDGPYTMCWDDEAASGVLQCSVAEFVSGKEPRPTEADLMHAATHFGQSQQWSGFAWSSSGRCVMGIYGTACFIQEASIDGDSAEYCQIWVLSNGLDFIVMTFIAMTTPPECELADAQRIVEGINFT